MERFRPERTAGRVQGGKAAIRGGSNQVFTAGTKLWWYQVAEQGRHLEAEECSSRQSLLQIEASEGWWPC